MFDAQDLQQTGAPSDASSGQPAPSLRVAASPPAGSAVRDLQPSPDRRRGVRDRRRPDDAPDLLEDPPLSRQRARQQIQDERTTAVGNLNANDPMFWQDSEQYYNTQYSILRSRGLAKRVVQQAAAAEPPALQRHRAAGPRAAREWCARRGRRSGSSVRGLILERRAETCAGSARGGRERGGERLDQRVPRRRRDHSRRSDAARRDRIRLSRIRRSPRWPRRRSPRNTRSRTSTCASRPSTRTSCGSARRWPSREARSPKRNRRWPPTARSRTRSRSRIGRTSSSRASTR